MEDFQWSIKTGNLSSVKTYIEQGGIDVNAPDASIKKRTPLHYAADFGQEEVAAYLLSKGANVNALDGFGITPLLAAVYEDHAGVVKILLKHGADTSIKGPDGNTAAEAADGAEVKDLLNQ